MRIDGENVEPEDLPGMSIKDAMACLNGVTSAMISIDFPPSPHENTTLGLALQDIADIGVGMAEQAELNPHGMQELREALLRVKQEAEKAGIFQFDAEYGYAGIACDFVVRGLQCMLGARFSDDKKPLDFAKGGRTNAGLDKAALLPAVQQ